MRLSSIARRILEYVLGPIVLRRRLPRNAGRGKIVVSVRVGGLKYCLKPARDWDRDLLRAARTLVHTGDSVWDVGANLGLFSVAAAYFAGSGGAVVAIEADSDAVVLLNRTRDCQAADRARLTILPVAIGDSVGLARFSVARRARASNALDGYGSTQMGGIREVRLVPSTTLDSLLDQLPRPDVLKIDVEGAEMSVLAGADQVLREVRPAVYCEVTEKNASEARDLFEGYRYTVFDGTEYQGVGDDPASRCHRNTVAIPNEMVG